MGKLLQLGLLLAAMAVIGNAAAAGGRAKTRSLESLQEAYAAAIRWNDIDSAAAVVDPEYQQAHPQSDFERARYQQLQISGYQVLRAGMKGEDEALREVEIRMINRNTQAERSVRVREIWRWDARRKQWWLSNGLPDLWQGQ